MHLETTDRPARSRDGGDTQLTAPAVKIARYVSRHSILKAPLYKWLVLRTKSTFIIITGYAVIRESSLPSVVLNNRKACKLEMHVFLMRCCVQMRKSKDLCIVAVLKRALWEITSEYLIHFIKSTTYITSQKQNSK